MLLTKPRGRIKLDVPQRWTIRGSTSAYARTFSTIVDTVGTSTSTAYTPYNPLGTTSLGKRAFGTAFTKEFTALMKAKSPSGTVQRQMIRRRHFHGGPEYMDGISGTGDSFESYEAFSDLKDAIEINFSSAPTVGSVIEFVDPVGSRKCCGVVVKEAESRFDENYNKMTVLSTKNELVSVSAIDVTFHMYRLFRDLWVRELTVLEQRYDRAHAGRIDLLYALNGFLARSAEYVLLLRNGFDIFYSQVSEDYFMKPVSLGDVLDSIKLDKKMWFDTTKFYYHQCVLLMAFHLTMQGSPQWIVSTSNHGGSNVYHRFSNTLAPDTIYFVNSRANWTAIQKMESDFDSPDTFEACDQFLVDYLVRQTSESPHSFDEVNLHFNIWEGRHFKHLIDVMKFAIVYPHPRIIESLQRLTVLEKVSPASLMNLLQTLNIYNDSENRPTDIFLSAHIAGKPLLSQLAVTFADELQTNLLNSMQLDSDKTKDKFPHLRTKKRYYHDHIIYALPGKGNSSLAVSLERLNSRKYSVNVHIPDLASKISPTSDLFAQLSSNPIRMKGFKGINDTAGEILDPDFKQKLGFSTQHVENNDIYLAGDPVDRTPRSSLKITCLTFSFEYNIYDSDPFADLTEKITFSFDSLGTVRIKALTWKDLEECLSGKNEISPFRLFKRTAPNPSLSDGILNLADTHNINFIANFMKSHFKHRNIDGSLSSRLFDEVGISIKSKLDDNQLISSLQLSRDNSPLSTSFLNELDMFVGGGTAAYCLKHNIPSLRHVQELEGVEHQNDSTFVSHDNILLPNFHSNSYHQTLLARDKNGYVSDLAFVIGNNYMGKKDIDVHGYLESLPLGLKSGYVRMVGVFDEFEPFLNQQQILSHCQQLYLYEQPDRKTAQKGMSYLKRYGYNLYGPNDADRLDAIRFNIKSANSFAGLLSKGIKKYWVLKYLEHREVDYECIITHLGHRQNDKTIAKAYCRELGIEVDVVLKNATATMGSQIRCDKVFYLDPVAGECVLEERDVF